MNYETFQKGQELQARIKNLEFFKQGLITLFTKEAFNAKLEVHFLGSAISYPVDGFLHKNIGNYINSEDAKYFLDAIDSKIEEIKKEFETI